MEIYDTDKYCIITPLCPRLGERETKRLFSRIEMISSEKIGLDLSYVMGCTIDFLENISKIKNVGIFNIPSDIFSLILSMNIDKKVPLFVSRSDFEENKRRLLNRQFTVV